MNNMILLMLMIVFCAPLISCGGKSENVIYVIAISGSPTNYDELRVGYQGSLMVAGARYSVPLEIRGDGSLIEETEFGGIVVPIPAGTRRIEVRKPSVKMYYALQRIEYAHTPRQKEFILAKGTIDNEQRQFKIDLSEIDFELEELVEERPQTDDDTVGKERSMRPDITDSEVSVLKGFVFIPEGTYGRGDYRNEEVEDFEVSRPVHEVFVSGFFMGETQVTYQQWREVYDWAIENGFRFDNQGQYGSNSDGAGLSDNDEASMHPVVNVNWYDAVKWCNAKSIKSGLEPVYYIDEQRSTIYRRGRYDLGAGNVDWESNGYRLPTEAEWEKAARGGLEGMCWPWGNDDISSNRANYGEDEGRGTTPVGSFPPNAYGLFDMAGNVWEMCWDWFDEDWYSSEGATTADGHGPDSGGFRVNRGGSWKTVAWSSKVAFRLGRVAVSASNDVGFRLVKGTSEGL